jgi:glutamate-1-semialdehyde 2,1-aminomutase
MMDFNEIQKRREQLAEGPVFAIPEERVAELAKQLAERTPRSKQLYDAAKRCIPGGTQHMLVIKNPHPLTIERALGARVWDADGNEYIDYLMMAGPIILGHNYPPLIEKVTHVIHGEGIGTGWTSEWEIKSAELIIRHMKNVDMVRFFQSGTEADMAAARLARAYTGKTKLLRIGGSYHGWADEFVYDMQVPYSGTFQTQGIPEQHWSNVISVGPGDVEALERAFEQGESEGGVAAVIVEGAGCEAGAIPFHPDFYRTCRELCDRHESLFILDEVVTGFRLALGGAQEFYGIDADLSVLGKIITHGFPSAGALGGRKEIMECLAGLNPNKPKPFVAGTMAGNAISTAATYWALRFIEEQDAIAKATAAGEKLSKGLNDLFESMGRPFFSYNIGSIIHYETAGPLTVDIRREGGIADALARKKAVDDLATALLGEGIVSKYGNRAFTCMAHTDQELGATLRAFEKCVGMMQEQN